MLTYRSWNSHFECEGRTYLICNKSIKTVIDALDIVSLGQGQSDKGSDCSIHPTGWGADVHHCQISGGLQQKLTEPALTNLLNVSVHRLHALPWQNISNCFHISENDVFYCTTIIFRGATVNYCSVQSVKNMTIIFANINPSYRKNWLCSVVISNDKSTN